MLYRYINQTRFFFFIFRLYIIRILKFCLQSSYSMNFNYQNLPSFVQSIWYNYTCLFSMAEMDKGSISTIYLYRYSCMADIYQSLIGQINPSITIYGCLLSKCQTHILGINLPVYQLQNKVAQPNSRNPLMAQVDCLSKTADRFPVSSGQNHIRDHSILCCGRYDVSCLKFGKYIASGNKQIVIMSSGKYC